MSCWASLEQVLCRHMVSPGATELRFLHGYIPDIFWKQSGLSAEFSTTLQKPKAHESVHVLHNVHPVIMETLHILYGYFTSIGASEAVMMYNTHWIITNYSNHSKTSITNHYTFITTIKQCKTKTCAHFIAYPDSKNHGAHLGPVGPSWAPCWPHKPCYQGMYIKQQWQCPDTVMTLFI